jgi:hypothetical protein
MSSCVEEKNMDVQCTIQHSHNSGRMQHGGGTTVLTRNMLFRLITNRLLGAIDMLYCLYIIAK